jgi:hypothetical protein
MKNGALGIKFTEDGLRSGKALKTINKNGRIG